MLGSGRYPRWVLMRTAVSEWVSPFPTQACLQDGARWLGLAAGPCFGRSHLCAEGAPTFHSDQLSFSQEENTFQGVWGWGW